MKRIFLITAITLLILTIPIFLLSRGRPEKIRLLNSLMFQSLDKVKRNYAGQSCLEFSPRELRQGYFMAMVTGYCKPQAADFKNRSDFLCAVGLNCSCPKGRDESASCAMKQSFVWSPCLEFDDQNTEYCHQTASQTKPQSGTLAADWRCFAPQSFVNIHGQNYQVTDKGSAITGRRFDIWFDDCRDAFKVLGIYKITIPEK